MILELLISGALQTAPTAPPKLVNIKPNLEQQYAIVETIELKELEPLEEIKYISTPTPTVTSAPKTVRQSTAGNTYSYGYCTWHTKNLLSWVPNGLGDAHNWINGLTRTTARPGVVAWEPGHVSVVISVSDGMTTVSEMNYKGWNVASTRTAPSSHFVYLQ